MIDLDNIEVPRLNSAEDIDLYLGFNYSSFLYEKLCSYLINLNKKKLKENGIFLFEENIEEILSDCKIEVHFSGSISYNIFVFDFEICFYNKDLMTSEEPDHKDIYINFDLTKQNLIKERKEKVTKNIKEF